MGLADVVMRLTVMVVILLSVSASVMVGPRRIVRAVRDYRWRLAEIGPYLSVLLVVLAVRKLTMDYTGLLSWALDWNITLIIYSLEGALVADVQSLRSPLLTDYFVFIYLYGYVFLLLFPFVAYFARSDMTSMKELIVAYTFNYGVGLVCYVLFIAYGPRNLIPDIVDSLLYVTYPQSQLLTGEVNHNTNVFPSLHASLSMTTFFLAWRTRDEYPLWAPVSFVLGVSVALSTMYLGIHWATDVVAGTLLAVLSILVTEYVVEHDLLAEWGPFGREWDLFDKARR
ncbi:inositol phosphorylceramide synthase [Halostella sp. JP-L12]|uniref:phosphatase PAP2 family protein n=1 Tax=Halostella TaxID=1843185 RepID=UPI000EF7D8A7|nr:MULTISPECIES: phosphatase PAP2 family protein [Halostella]NHN48589.1 inositol phosphorylceramide synthase [Halostella sp. JP-L12]